MTGRAYYNEKDKFAAQWLRNLIEAGHIAPGDVDERDIQDVLPSDLDGYTQCHFFAGIGIWSYALRKAGWPDDRPVWTGSCPCQPFSTAGKGAAFADERHLWPAWHHLISQRRPPEIFGEQVASKDTDPWIDLVQDDLEGLGYAVGAVPFPAAGVGSPNIRDRLYWMADATSGRWSKGRLHLAEGVAAPSCRKESECGHDRTPGRLADTNGGGAQRRGRDSGEATVIPQGQCQPEHDSDVLERGRPDNDGCGIVQGHGLSGDSARPGPTNGFWRDADWILCRDGKWRPVEPGTFPLAYEDSTRVGRLRAYGNAINAEAAETVIRAYLQAAAHNDRVE